MNDKATTWIIGVLGGTVLLLGGMVIENHWGNDIASKADVAALRVAIEATNESVQGLTAVAAGLSRRLDSTTDLLGDFGITEDERRKKMRGLDETLDHWRTRNGAVPPGPRRPPGQ